MARAIRCYSTRVSIANRYRFEYYVLWYVLPARAIPGMTNYVPAVRQGARLLTASRDVDKVALHVAEGKVYISPAQAFAFQCHAARMSHTNTDRSERDVGWRKAGGVRWINPAGATTATVAPTEYSEIRHQSTRVVIACRNGNKRDTHRRVSLSESVVPPAERLSLCAQSTIDLRARGEKLSGFSCNGEW